MTKPLSEDSYLPLVAATRGGIVESVHYGAAVAADTEGKVLFSWGDPDAVTFLRSSAKPFQAAAWLARGVDRAFGFDLEEIALAIGSHNAEARHLQVLARMMEKAGVRDEDLRCGVRPPLHKGTREAMRDRGEKPTVRHSNCSGKHTGMIALAKHLKAPVEGYIEPEHPVQKAMLASMAAFCGAKEEDIGIGIDGCGVCTFAMSMRQGARAFARLLDASGMEGRYAQAAAKVREAMTAHPFLVAGSERLDTALMQAGANWDMTAKVGAEGYQGLAFRLDGRAVGLAVKISDGDHANRARDFIVLQALKHMGLPLAEAPELQPFRKTDILNASGKVAGRLEIWKR